MLFTIVLVNPGVTVWPVPRPRNTEQRRAEIVRGLQLAMAEHGYERASVATVARHAGLAAGLVHYHFRSKEEILLALGEHLAATLTERYQQLRARSDGRAGKVHPTRQPLYDLIDAHLALGDGSDPTAVAAWVALSAEATFKAEVGQLYERLLQERQQLLRQLIGDSMRAEGRTRRGAATIAAAMVASIEGFYLVASAAASLVPHGSAARAARAMLDGLLDAQPPS